VEDHEPRPLRGCRILVVEDDLDAASLNARLLERLGASVAVAANGREGLDRLAEFPADVVLCDLTMPVMDGIDFARHVRRDPRLWGILLVAVTGHQEHATVLRTWEAGYDAHLVKPVTVEMLQSVARRVSGRRAGQERSGA
jgi:two-component system CheB/CheR fusion protein